MAILPAVVVVVGWQIGWLGQVAQEVAPAAEVVGSG